MAARSIFVNVAVSDVPRTREFFSALGFSFNENFSDENAVCMVINDNASVMLLAQPFFSTFTKKSVADSTATTEAILALSAESREAVDEMVSKAIDAGGKPSNDPMDHGFMYASSFQDLDGHLWEVMWMDPQAAADGPPTA